MFASHPDDTRRVLYQAWQKHLTQQPLQPLEQNIVNIISEHPEYHAVFAQPDKPYQAVDGTMNPFMHIGLHLTLAEQIHLDNPAGIKNLFTRLHQRLGCAHRATHCMMDTLADHVQNLLTQQRPFTGEAYLEQLKHLL